MSFVSKIQGHYVLAGSKKAQDLYNKVLKSTNQFRDATKLFPKYNNISSRDHENAVMFLLDQAVASSRATFISCTMPEPR